MKENYMGKGEQYGAEWRKWRKEGKRRKGAQGRRRGSIKNKREPITLLLLLHFLARIAAPLPFRTTEHLC
jgi:hypothetical protein